MAETMPRRRLFSSLGSVARSACVPEGPAPVPTLEQHAAQRLTFGPRPGDVEAIETAGYANWLDEQLDPDSIDDSALAPYLAAVPNSTLGENWATLYDRRNASWPIPVQPLYDVEHATWQRILHSERQLYERIVNFWHEHFSIFGGQYIIRSLFPKWDETIRARSPPATGGIAPAAVPADGPGPGRRAARRGRRR